EIVADLLPFVTPHRSFDLLLDRRKIERGRRLHRWIFDRGLREVRYLFLNPDKAPELPREKVIHVAASAVIEAFAAHRRCALERILAQVHDGRHVARYLFAGPAIGLLQ